VRIVKVRVNETERARKHGSMKAREQERERAT